MEVVTAGVVLMARRRIPWESLGRILCISPETARHTYHERLVQRRLNDCAPHLALHVPQRIPPPTRLPPPTPNINPTTPSHTLSAHRGHIEHPPPTPRPRPATGR